MTTITRKQNFMNERYLVTGALGCVGAWAVRRLVREGVPVWTYDLGGDPYRLRMIMTDEELDQVRLIEGDITNLDEFERVVIDCGITHILHLAAMQVPLVRADPVRGAKVNVVGEPPSRLRNGCASSRPDPELGLCKLVWSVRRSGSVPSGAARPRRSTAASDSLRGVQAVQRGHSSGLLAGAVGV